MNIGLVHPYISYLLIFIIVTSLSSWLVDFIKKKNELITLISFYGNILSIISISIFNSIFIIFIYSAGFFVNGDLFLGILWIGIYIYCANEFLKTFNEEFRDNKKHKLFVKIIVIGPFIVSFVIAYLLFYGDKIYKLSLHCENTNDPKIKVCKYSNGTYTGEMKAFKRHGQGEYIWNDGTDGTWKGKWIEGKRVPHTQTVK
tara:strand:+ start:642 stop:1244 length:603 start_codon:yes stop_codon:yes gene_type:complete